MNWKLLDSLRRNAGPVQVDLVEAYAAGKINRRDFTKRGTVIGLSAPFMGAVLAACGGDDGGDTGSSDGATSDATDAADSGDSGATAQGGTLIIGNQVGDSASGLDPVAMLDLGTYNVIAQSFEFLVGLADDGGIGDTGLATSWEPNEAGDVWTFNLREGVQWQDGSDFTSADVAATMDRLAAAENAGLAGVIAEGAVETPDDLTAVFNLEGPNGNFPFLVSIFNPQAVITPADYSSGTTLDERPAGTGAWVLDDFDPSTFVARFSKNPNWWGGDVALDGIELRGFADLGTGVTAMNAREIDALQSFTVIGGEGLLNDENFVVLTPPASSHRKLWFNTQEGQFTDPLIREALAWAVNRQQIIDVIYSGRALLGNDHPLTPDLPFFPEGVVDQREQDIDRARELLAEAGVETVSAEIATGDIAEVPEIAALIAQQAREAGFEFTVREQSNSTFYGDAWCPGASESDDTLPCEGSAEIGIVDWGHRPVPDIFLTSGLATGGVWNAANYASEEYDTAVGNYQAAVGVDEQREALSDVVQILHQDTPAIFHSFWNYLSGHDDSVSGIQATALGHTIVTGASKEA